MYLTDGWLSEKSTALLGEEYFSVLITMAIYITWETGVIQEKNTFTW